MINHEIQIFTYGTLSFDEIMKIVAGETFSHEPAVLRDHARYAVKGQLFPAVRAKAGGRVRGLLHRGVNREALERIDFFEDSFYLRQSQVVESTFSGPQTAQTYIVPPEQYSVLSEKSWEETEFLENHFEQYQSRAKKWMADFQPAAKT